MSCKPLKAQLETSQLNRFQQEVCHKSGLPLPRVSCAPGFAVLQKASTQQGDHYRIGPYKTFCRDHMFLAILAFVREMVSPMFIKVS
jgi:hypothetical protein